MNIALRVLGETFLSVIYFPVWWYSSGFFGFLRKSGARLSDFNKTVGFTVWLGALGVPLYGQNDFGGRIISILIRLVNIIIRGLLLLLFFFFSLSLVILWLIFPIAIIYQLFYGY